MELQNFVQKEARDVATQVYKDLGTQMGVAQVPVHIHNGIDTNQIPFSSISPNFIYIHWTLPGITAATNTNYGVFWTAPFSCAVVAMTEVHQTAGTNGGAVTLQLEKLTRGQALDGGVVLLTTALSLKTTADTPQSGALTMVSTENPPDSTTGIRYTTLLAGDRLALKDTGTLTSVAGVTVMITIQI